MKRSARRLASLAVVGALGLAAAACGSDDSSESGDTTASTASGDESDGGDDGSGDDGSGDDGAADDGSGSDEPAPSGEPVEFVMAIHADPSGIDPQTAVNGSDNVNMFPAFDTLINYDPSTLEFGPGLAESWEFNDDFTEMTLTLREGVKFHDGTDLNAASAIASMERFQEIGHYPYLDGVTAFEALGDYEFKLVMAEPNASMVGLLAERAGMVVSAEAAAQVSVDEFKRLPVGTGPFRVVEWRAGDQVVYERFEDYWNPDAVHLDRIVMRIIPDRQAVVNALLAGEIDFSEGLDGSDIERLQGSSDLEVSTPIGLWYYQMYLDHSQAPLDDVRVRRAIAHAIDRDLLIEGAVNGLGEPAWYHLPSVHWAYDEAMTRVWEYDPDLSRQLLEEAGYGDGVSFTIVHQPSPTEVRRIEIVKSMLAEVGIDMQLNPMDLTQGVTEYFENQAFNAALFAYPGRLDAVDVYFSKFDKDQFTNVAKREYPGMQDLLAQARATDDPDVMFGLFEQMNEIIVDEVPDIPLYYRLNLTAHSTDFTGYVPDLMGQARVHTMRPAG